MADTLTSQELQRVLRRVYNNGLTGYLTLEEAHGTNKRYATLSLADGQLVKAVYAGLSGRAAVDALRSRNFAQVLFVQSPIDAQGDRDIPHLAELLNDEGGSSADLDQTGSAAEASLLATLQQGALTVLEQAYGAAGARKVHEIIAKFPVRGNPSLFIDRCEELLVPMYGEVRAGQLMQPLYGRLGT